MVCAYCSVSQSGPTLCNPMDCSPPGSSVHGDSPGKNTGVGCHALLQGIFVVSICKKKKKKKNPNVLAPETNLVENDFPMDQGQEDGFRMIQAH